ncbi:hypothetical protein GCM10027160_07390 [Streptomyces calidiresistens]
MSQSYPGLPAELLGADALTEDTPGELPADAAPVLATPAVFVAGVTLGVGVTLAAGEVIK